MEQEQVMIMNITPQIAAQFLGVNLRNRDIKTPYINTLANEMNGGTFKYNGDTIRFGKSGKLLDGQHRLYAIMKSNTTQKMIVATGIDDEAFATIDVGKNRTLGDVLSINGISQYRSEKATTTKLVYMYENNLLARNESIRKRLNVRSHTKMMEYYQEHQLEIDNSVSFVAKLGKCIRKVSTFPIFATMHYELSKIDAIKADIFIESVARGINCNQDDPAFVLREKLISSKEKNRKNVAKEVFPLFAKAWNYERKGLKIKYLSFSENLPKLI